MMFRRLAFVVAIAACCGNHNSHPDASSDAVAACTTGTVSGMGVLQDFCPPGDPGANAFLLSASGEVLAIVGYRFPPVNPGDFALVDGWDITYSNVISTFTHVKLSENPDTSCTDQSQTGPLVAEVDGPWAIDLHKGGSLVGKEGPPEQAAPIAEITNQNMNGGKSFDPTMRYAFGFDIIPATVMAKNVNLDAADLTLYQEMVTKGCTTMLVGQAVWKGNNNGSLTNSGCTQTTVTGAACSAATPCPTGQGLVCAGAVGSQTCQPDFSAFPTTINFHLCLPAPTTYINAQNPENDPAMPCAGEEHQRGVHTVQNEPTVIQATFHIDHVLWESFIHDSPAHFDSYASKKTGAGATVALTFDDMKGQPFTPFVDTFGHQVPWRNCVGASYTPPSNGAMSFDTQGRTVNPNGTCMQGNCNVIRDFADYTLFNHSTFGHLNADGLAFVSRDFPSPM